MFKRDSENIDFSRNTVECKLYNLLFKLLTKSSYKSNFLRYLWHLLCGWL